MNQHHHCLVYFEYLVRVSLLLLYHIVSVDKVQFSSGVLVKTDLKPPTYTHMCPAPPVFPVCSYKWCERAHSSTAFTSYSRFGFMSAMFQSVWKDFDRNACVHLSAMRDDTLKVPMMDPEALRTLVPGWRCEPQLSLGSFVFTSVSSSCPSRSLLPSLLLLLLFWFPLWNVTFGDLDRLSWGFCTLGGDLNRALGPFQEGRSFPLAQCGYTYRFPTKMSSCSSICSCYSPDFSFGFFSLHWVCLPACSHWPFPSLWSIVLPLPLFSHFFLLFLSWILIFWAMTVLLSTPPHIFPALCSIGHYWYGLDLPFPANQ